MNTPTTPTRVNLAAALQAAHTDKFAAESAVLDLIQRLFPGWQLLFPARRSWQWTPPDIIEVWNANGTDAAVRAFMHAGFVGGVTIHGHRAERFLSCTCTRWVRPSAADPRTP